MKFKICHDPERKALSIPRAALQISGLDGQDELHLHADDGCVLLLPERPSAGEAVKTIQMLVDINTQLISNLAAASRRAMEELRTPNFLFWHLHPALPAGRSGDRSRI